MSDGAYAAASVWNQRYRTILETGDPDRSSQWLSPFLPAVTADGCRDVLDLGCGTGHDSLALARHGLAVHGIDHAQVAIDEARRMAEMAGVAADFRQGDIGQPLPYGDGAFDAAISNLVLHSFPDASLRRIVAEVERCLRPGGLFLFHANSTEDAPRRLAAQPPERQTGPWSYVLAGGQTMHFFSEDYCRDLLAGWRELKIEAAVSRDAEGRPIKHAWRCIARKTR
jgi:SAM-dependent methyltransferase